MWKYVPRSIRKYDNRLVGSANDIKGRTSEQVSVFGYNWNTTARVYTWCFLFYTSPKSLQEQLFSLSLQKRTLNMKYSNSMLRIKFACSWFWYTQKMHLIISLDLLKEPYILWKLWSSLSYLFKFNTFILLIENWFELQPQPVHGVK